MLMKRLRIAAAPGVIAAAMTGWLAVLPAHAATSATQSTQVSVVGVLSISAAQGTVNEGNVGTDQSGQALVPVGTINETNTLGDGLAWSVSVAATDMVVSGFTGSCTPSTGCIAWTSQAFGYMCGSANGPTVPANVSNGNTYFFLGGTDTTPGTTYSPAITILNGTSSQQGSFFVSGCDWEAGIPSLGNQEKGNYTGHLQYTITG